MRLFSTLLIAAAYAEKSTRSSWKKLESEGTSKYQELKKVTTHDESNVEINEIQASWETSLQESHQQVDIFVGRTSLIDRDPGQCSLHWNLCPNHCTLSDELPNRFSKIRGDIMSEHKRYQDRVRKARDEIVEDLKGKMDEFNGLMTDISKNRNQLEARESRFLAQLQQDYARVQSVNDRLLDLRDNVQEDKKGYVELNKRASDAYNSCYDQAPCMGTQRCRFGVPSGSSCADIVEDLTETTPYDEQTLRVDSGVFMVNAGAAGAKPVQCEFTQGGNAWTVLHHYENSTYSRGDWQNGFGSAASFGDAACGAANYWAGDDFIDAIARDSESILAETESDASVFTLQASRGQYTAGNAQKLCGSSINGGQVSGVLNNHSGFQQFKRIAFGKMVEKSHPVCLNVADYGNYGQSNDNVYGGDAYGSYYLFELSMESF